MTEKYQCPGYKHQNDPDAEFCEECGLKLILDETLTPESESSPEQATETKSKAAGQLADENTAERTTRYAKMRQLSGWIASYSSISLALTFLLAGCLVFLGVSRDASPLLISGLAVALAGYMGYVITRAFSEVLLAVADIADNSWRRGA